MNEDIVVTITLNGQTGEISVNGPLANEMVMYGLLEKARQITENYVKSNTQPLITPAIAFPSRIQ